MSDGALDPVRRAGLLLGKLNALVPAADGATARHDANFSAGAAVVDGDTSWILVESATTGLGSALAWAARQGTPRVNVVVDGAAAADVGIFARQAQYFATPPLIWGVDGRRLVPARPAAWPAHSEPPAEARPHIEVLADAGLEIVIEDGVVRGEVLGLEVARVVVAADEPVRVEVGVGRNDREAFAMLHGDLPTEAALASVIDTVRRHRRAGANPHPLNQLAASRWLRTHLITDPSRLPGWTLEPVVSLVPRAGLNDEQPAYAVGHDDHGRPVVLACAVGIDLDLVPHAADLRSARAPDAHLVLAVPARDAHPRVHELAAALTSPAEVLPVEGRWRL